ncbi:MAG: Inositol monophosphatase [Candidatus Jorgensenbacteria bacterium GW2011_GWA2_45_13]|uniref:Inositol monophosphatase n=1 Tax=Candidatus Jorgensenbacteria bacterium GW2011_GWA2_45_13 TaxID=1618662 RepID=A0A0G1L769_9BACT|nr:MAG: Inositol monophosphatase [Candidatus Jorgensenbacteria bacterium GW2011_GWA2_45_13]
MNKELKLAIETAEEAGAILLQYYGTNLDVSIKDNNTPVSNADIAANNFIIEKLSANFPYPILSEESADNQDRLHSYKIWIVDPLDGTRDFIGKTGEFAIEIALVQTGEPILGVVYAPVTKELFWAEKGRGAYRKTDAGVQTLKVSKIDSFSEARFTIPTLSPEQISAMEDMGAKNRTRVGSIALKMCRIAQGEYEAYFFPTSRTAEWDDCGAGVILTEAGGALSDLFGKPLLYNQPSAKRTRGIVASNGVLHSEILKRVSSITKERYEMLN